MLKLAATLALVVATAVACSDNKPAEPAPTPVQTAPVQTAPPTPPTPPAPPAPPATDPTPTATNTATAADAEANAIFTTRCAACHGVSGKGDGAAAAALTPKPRDYSDKGWQAKVTDEHIAKIIVEGGPAVGMSPMMGPNADLANKPDVVKALVAKVRSFGKT